MRKIRRYLTPVITALLWVTMISLTTLTINFVFGQDENVFVISLISTALMVLTTILWMPTGIEMGEKVVKVHNNMVIYQNRASYIVDNQMFKKADDFCDYKNDLYERELKQNALTKVLVEFDDFIKFETYYRKYKSKNCTEKDKLEYQKFTNDFTEKQVKVMTKLASKGVKFDKLKTDDLIKYHNTHNRLKPKNTEASTRNIRIIVKVVWGVLLGMGTVGLLVQSNGFGWEQALQLMLWTVSILSNIFTSIWTSYRSVTVNRNNYLIEKNDRCAEFFNYCNLKVSEIDMAIKDKLWENPEIKQ